MKKFLLMSAIAALFGLIATAAPADAATRNKSVVTAEKATQLDLSARRYHRRYGYRHYRHYYGRPYYYPYAYYAPRYYYPYAYGYPYYYRRPGFFFGFGF